MLCASVRRNLDWSLGGAQATGVACAVANVLVLAGESVWGVQRWTGVLPRHPQRGQALLVLCSLAGPLERTERVVSAAWHLLCIHVTCGWRWQLLRTLGNSLLSAPCSAPEACTCRWGTVHPCWTLLWFCSLFVNLPLGMCLRSWGLPELQSAHHQCVQWCVCRAPWPPASGWLRMSVDMEHSRITAGSTILWAWWGRPQLAQCKFD